MVIESASHDQLWRMLWSRSAHQVVELLPKLTTYDPTVVGYGIGLRSPYDQRKALVLHPAGQGRATGDLAVTVAGEGTFVIPRRNQSYCDYLTEVTNVVDSVATIYLSA